MSITKEQRKVRRENAARRNRARSALEQYDGGSDGESVVDLMTDLMHFCRKEDIDYHAADRMAFMNYEAECEEAGQDSSL